jgi:alkylation response protein AidB-like acyl-CoA dehydrogenase
MVAAVGTAERVTATRTDWVAVARALGAVFGERAAALDAADAFAVENYADLKRERVFSAGVPAELGGGGATHREVCALLHELGRHCGSTALALSMHQHLIGALIWRWRHGLSGEALLRRVADEEIVLVSTGGSDWLEGSGTAVPVDGGFRVSGRKIFGSGALAGDVMLTTAVYADPEAGPTVLHFSLPMRQDGVRVLDTWRALGMRATGSHDIEIDDVFVPEAAISLRRPQGVWHGFFDTISVFVWPLVTAAYLGVAEGARDIAVAQAARKRDQTLTQLAVGELENELGAARLAQEAMIALANDYDFTPSVANSQLTYIYKGLATRSSVRAVERAMEVAGGASFARSLGLERRFRDIQGARFHPWQEQQQRLFAGRIALGLEPVAARGA